jgi:hypothetical protein
VTGKVRRKDLPFDRLQFSAGRRTHLAAIVVPPHVSVLVCSKNRRRERISVPVGILMNPLSPEVFL